METATVTFDVTKMSASYAFEYLYVQNTIDPTPLHILATPSSMSTTGFSVFLSAITDSANYVLYWKVIVV